MQTCRGNRLCQALAAHGSSIQPPPRPVPKYFCQNGVVHTPFAGFHTPTSVLPSPFQSPDTGMSPGVPNVFCQNGVVHSAFVGFHTPTSVFLSPNGVVQRAFAG